MGNVIRRNVSFKPIDFATVQSMAKDSGFSFSGGLRQIIRQWAQQQRLLDLGRAVAAGLIPPDEAVERLAVLAGDGHSGETEYRRAEVGA